MSFFFHFFSTFLIEYIFFVCWRGAILYVSSTYHDWLKRGEFENWIKKSIIGSLLFNGKLITRRLHWKFGLWWLVELGIAIVIEFVFEQSEWEIDSLWLNLVEKKFTDIFFQFSVDFSTHFWILRILFNHKFYLKLFHRSFIKYSGRIFSSLLTGKNS